MAKGFSTCVMVLAAVCLAACSGENSLPAGPEQRESRSIELDKAEKVNAEIKIGSGELDIRGGAQKLMDGEFTYNVEAWKPDIRYSSSGGSGDLKIEQPGSNSTTGKAKNHWDIHFNDTVPLNLAVNFGAGDARLNVSSMNLRGLEVAFGAGKLELDLRGTPSKDYSAAIRGGVGEAIVHLPKNVGVSANVKGGLGEVSAEGLHKNGDTYTNDANETAKVKIHLDIKGGVGSIKLVTD